MYPRRSSRLPKVSKKSPERNPSPDEEVIQRRLRGKRQGTRLTKSKASDGVVNSDEKDRDIIDIINSTHKAEQAAEEDEGKFVEVADKGVDESDEECASVTSSVASGPSLSYLATPSQGRCSDCQKLYQKARRMKAQIKNKLLDNDPKSLTCDQWVLIKKWRSRRLLNTRGKLLIYVQLVKKRVGVKRSEQYAGESSVCSRPHIFLQRNLRRCVKVPVKQERKKNKRRKRTRDDSQGSRVAKQQRLHSNTHRQHSSTCCTDDKSRHPARARSSRSGFEDCDDQEIDSQAHRYLTVESVPSTGIRATTRPTELPPKKKTPKKTSGFRNLLAQLRSNSSMIVRETC